MALPLSSIKCLGYNFMAWQKKKIVFIFKKKNIEKVLFAYQICLQ